MTKIVQAPNDVLSTPAKPIAKIDKSIHELLKTMRETLLSAHDPEGVGLAAPQIGKPYQVFITKDSPESEILTYINPEIKEFKENPKEKKSDSENKKRKEKGVQLEGCLSLKDIWGVVKRHDVVVLSYLDEKGEKHTKSFDGFMAVIIQHEFDHLQGILFPKRVLEQKQKLYKSIKNKKGETEFDELEI